MPGRYWLQMNCHSMIREMMKSDDQRILEIYKMGMKTGNATFESTIPTWEEWDIKHHSHSRFIFVDDEKVVGWVAIAPVSTRKVYGGVAEVSVYTDLAYSGKGIGLMLMETVIESSERQGIWTLCSSIFPENTASLKIHYASGFRQIGIREKIACLGGVWRDTVIMERRSKVVGCSAMDIPDLLIRPAVVADRPAILDLYQELDAAYEHSPDEGKVDDQELWRQVMADTRQQILVGEQNGEIVGTVTLILVPNLGHRGKPWAAVENVAVLSSRRGQGLGTALMSEVTRIARSQGCYKIVLTSNLTRQRAHEFYRRLGWQQTHAGFSLSLAEDNQKGSDEQSEPTG
jgi:L-amino acid N-acyltransferase YncA